MDAVAAGWADWASRESASVEVGSDVDARGEIATLLNDDDPSIRYLARRDVLGDDPGSRGMRMLADEIRRSSTVAALLEGHVDRGPATYSAWQGAHWVALSLAEIAYPGGDARVGRMVDEVLDRWTLPKFDRDVEVERIDGSPPFVPIVAGKARRCASQQGAALLIAMRFDRADDPRTRQITRALLRWQWPDGGWNCDRRPAARMSSVAETLLPLRGLAAALGVDAPAVQRAAEVFLDRRIVYRRNTGGLLTPSVMKLRHPPYWHYDLLAGLGGMVDAHRIADPRCQDALDALEAKRLPGGGWAAEGRWYKLASGDATERAESVDWGPTTGAQPHRWVTMRALTVLAAAGRLTRPSSA